MFKNTTDALQVFYFQIIKQNEQLYYAFFIDFRKIFKLYKLQIDQ